MEAARVESDSRNESGAKDRVDSPEQVAGDLERKRERQDEVAGKVGPPQPGGWILMLERGPGG